MKFDRHAFWKNPGAPANVDAYSEAVIARCRPEFYLDLVNVTRLVVETVKKYAIPAMSITELGCGTGRNLVGLYKAGFEEVFGVELSQDAFDLGMKTFPELAKIMCLIAPVENVIKNLPEFDVIFTQGLLMLLPPDLEWVISEMAAKARFMIFTIEGERPPSFHAWPHDYQQIIEADGKWEQVEVHTCEDWEPLPKTTVLRVFLRVDRNFQLPIGEADTVQAEAEAVPVEPDPAPIAKPVKPKRIKKTP
jgi:SAM-dependent methyltransferase